MDDDPLDLNANLHNFLPRRQSSHSSDPHDNWAAPFTPYKLIFNFWLNLQQRNLPTSADTCTVSVIPPLGQHVQLWWQCTYGAKFGVFFTCSQRGTPNELFITYDHILVRGIHCVQNWHLHRKKRGVSLYPTGFSEPFQPPEGETPTTNHFLPYFIHSGNSTWQNSLV